MKKLLFILIIVITVSQTNGQASNYNKTDSLPTFYLGLGTGINSYTGLMGLSGNLRVHNKLFIQGGIGIGSWGTKYSIGLRYDMSYGKGWSYGIGYSSCSGLKDFKVNMELQSGLKQDITMDCLQAGTLNLKATYNWLIHKKNTFYLDFGYAIPLQTNPWIITDGSEISSNSKAVLNMMAPGGLTFGLGFTFGF